VSEVSGGRNPSRPNPGFSQVEVECSPFTLVLLVVLPSGRDHPEILNRSWHTVKVQIHNHGAEPFDADEFQVWPFNLNPLEN
jgi:hypothetical protein